MIALGMHSRERVVLAYRPVVHYEGFEIPGYRLVPLGFYGGGPKMNDGKSLDEQLKNNR
jgi:hypothetical protein